VVMAPCLVGMLFEELSVRRLDGDIVCVERVQ
jgi:hypothetical protein